MSETPQITFTLAPRLLTDGQIAIILHLYRGRKRALSTTLTTCQRQAAPRALRKCRSHLSKLGVEEISGVRLPAVSGLG